MNRTQPNGRVLGVDIIPAQPPKGVSTIQGNFLAPEIQAYIQDFLRNPNRGRPRQSGVLDDATGSLLEPGMISEAVQMDKEKCERTVDVVLSDMCEPWHQTSGFWKRSLSDPYRRMMNTSGNNFRDHAGSMVRAPANFDLYAQVILLTSGQDLCNAALRFSSDVLKVGGHFVCKFYQGAEDKDLEQQLRNLFQKVHRLKPESSRSVWSRPFLIDLGFRQLIAYFRNRKNHSLLALTAGHETKYLQRHCRSQPANLGPTAFRSLHSLRPRPTPRQLTRPRLSREPGVMLGLKV